MAQNEVTPMNYLFNLSFVKSRKFESITITLLISALIFALLLYLSLSYTKTPPEQNSSLYFQLTGTEHSVLTAQIPVTAITTHQRQNPIPPGNVVTQRTMQSIPVHESSALQETPQHLYSPRNKSTLENGSGNSYHTVPLGNHNKPGKNIPQDTADILYQLSERDLLSAPRIEEPYTQTGRVTISITVDREGNVLSAKFTPKGSTTSDPTLIKLAEETALKSKFSPAPDANEVQYGTISFRFELK